jgi:hypothetical protein
VKYILIGLGIYLAYRFIFNFVIPVYQATRKIRKGMNEMHSRMQEQSNQQQSSQPSGSKKPPVGDYIDFEEVN